MKYQSNLLLYWFCSLVILFSSCSAAEKATMSQEMHSKDIRITITSKNAKGHSRNPITLQLVFENTGEKRIRLLHTFTPLPVFFEFHLLREDGTPIPMPGAGKIDFARDAFRYVELEPRELFGFVFNLASILPSSQLDKGSYKLSVTYHNQYGNDCFIGKVSSSPIRLEVE